MGLFKKDDSSFFHRRVNSIVTTVRHGFHFTKRNTNEVEFVAEDVSIKNRAMHPNCLTHRMRQSSRNVNEFHSKVFIELHDMSVESTVEHVHSSILFHTDSGRISHEPFSLKRSHSIKVLTLCFVLSNEHTTPEQLIMRTGAVESYLNDHAFAYTCSANEVGMISVKINM